MSVYSQVHIMEISLYMKQCLELLKLCSLNDKECILESLIKDIDRDKSENSPMPSSNDNLNATELPSATEHFSYEKFISHYSSFVEDSSLLMIYG